MGIQHTPVLTFGRSLVARHFSKATMMAGKMLAWLETFLESSGVPRLGDEVKLLNLN